MSQLPPGCVGSAGVTSQSRASRRGHSPNGKRARVLGGLRAPSRSTSHVSHREVIDIGVKMSLSRGFSTKSWAHFTSKAFYHATSLLTLEFEGPDQRLLMRAFGWPTARL